MVTTNNLKTYMSVSLEAHANTAASTKAILLGMEDGGTEVSGTGVANSSGAKDSISFKGRNVMLPNT